ncbi:MAG: GNVR domain-containing protein [Myxococcales bacterium]
MPSSYTSQLRFSNGSQPPGQPGPSRELTAPPPPDGVEAAQLLAAIRRSRGFILKVSLLVGSAVMLFTLASRMTFKATGRLYLGEIENKNGAAQAPSDLALASNQQGEVSSEIEILRSESLVSHAILETGLNATLKRRGEWSTRYLPWLISGRDPQLVDGVLEEVGIRNAFASGEAARERRKYLVHFLDGEAYEVWAGGTSLGRGKLGEPQKTSETSWTLTAGSRGRPHSGAWYEVELRPLDRVLEETMDRLQINTPKQATGGDLVNVLTLEALDTSPHRAAAFLQTLMQGYLAERQAWKTEDASAAEAFVGEQLTGIKRSFEDIQQKLADFRTHNQVVVLGREGEAMIDRLGTYEAQRVTARLEVAALADVKRALSNPNPPMGAFLMGEANDTVLAGMGESLNQERAKLADLQARFSDVAPDVREQQSRVDAQLASIRSYVSSRLSRAQDTLGSLDGQIQQLNDRLKTLPGAELGLAQLSRESEVYSKTYSYLLERQQQAAIIKASTLSKNRVLDVPEPPVREDSPKLLLRLASFVAGLLIGVAIVVMRTVWSNNFQSEGDVQLGARGIPVLGTVPAHAAAKSKWKRKPSSGAEALAQALGAGPQAPFTEAIRALRASLRRWSFQGAGGVLLVSSPLRGDGKTTVALALASVLSAEGSRVLLLDATVLRHAMQDGSLGLTSILNGECRWQSAARRTPFAFTKFHLLPAGGETRPEGYSHERREQLLGELRQAFDYILIDAPSFPPASDVLSWAELADGVLSVIRPHHTPRKLAAEHLSRLSGFAQILAVVVNDAGPASRARLVASELTGSAVDEELLTIVPGEHPVSIPAKSPAWSARANGGPNG